MRPNYGGAMVRESLIFIIISFSFTVGEADKIIQLISPFLIIDAPRNIFKLSGNAKDNYLYDICIQNNCRYLISIDTEILADINAPFIRKTDAWLKKKKDK